MKDRWHIDGKRVLVVGLGASGRAAALLAKGRGAVVEATDLKTRGDLGDAIRDLEQAGVALHLGGHPEEPFVRADVVVVSPGVPAVPFHEQLTARKAEVMAEVEFAWRFLEARVIGVTGSNGKSTVTSLLGEMAARSGRPAFAGGNLGDPLSGAVGTEAGGPRGLLAVELSSFQLELISTLKPAVALLINLSEDHLDRYKTFEDYIEAKARIFMNQDARDHAVVWGGDPRAIEVARRGRAVIHLAGSPDAEVRREGNALVDRDAPGGPVRYPLERFKLAGEHNVVNASMAVLAARLAGIPAEAIRQGLESFGGLPHRMVFVAELAGVRYYNDSKATNVGAAVEALRGMDRPVVLIAGGRDKGGSYEPLRRVVKEKGRAVVVIGEAADRIAEAMRDAVPVHRAGTLEEAVQKAASIAAAGDAVLLAPACSSYDMFRNYEKRGEAFARAVKGLSARGDG